MKADFFLQESAVSEKNFGRTCRIWCELVATADKAFAAAPPVVVKVEAAAAVVDVIVVVDVNAVAEFSFRVSSSTGGTSDSKDAS